MVGEPLGAFNARWHRPLVQMAIGGGAAVLLALLVAGWLGRQILRPVWRPRHLLRWPSPLQANRRLSSELTNTRS